MIQKSQIEQLINGVMEDHEHLFVVELNLSLNSEIEVLVDSDLGGVTISECRLISRTIERWLEEEEKDASIVVSSPGLDKPLVNYRQYKKNINRKLDVRLKSQKQIKATLETVGEDYIVLVWKDRVPKPIGKGKQNVEFRETIPFTDIEKATVQISFK
ncbi:MAG: ribosome assembly cofactor RimP [Flavobacteriales bacterium]